MNILDLVKRSLVVPEAIKNSNKVFIFNGLNATSETLLQNLLFRLENHAPQSKIYIKQTPKDTIENSDLLYSWYRDDAETSKALATALKFNGSFRTPIDVISSYANKVPIINVNTSVIIIDTEGSLTIPTDSNSAKVILRNQLRFTCNEPKDIMILQGYLTESSEILGILKSNPESIDSNSLIGSPVVGRVKELSADYMASNISNEYDRAYMLSSRMMNVINNYITEGMKLDYSKSLTDIENLSTNYYYFDKTIDLFSEFIVGYELPHGTKVRISKHIKNRFDAKAKERAENSEITNLSMFTIESTRSMMSVFENPNFTTDVTNMVNYSNRNISIDERNKFIELCISISLMTYNMRNISDIRNSMSAENVIVYNMVFYEIITEILGGTFTW